MKSRTRYLVLAALFAALTAIGAFLRIPLPYIPFTLQTFFCALSGIVLGPTYGPLSQVVYLLVGLAGFPVFTGGGGLAYVVKPSFGYLLGFVLCAYVSGKIAEARETPGFGYLLLAASAGLVSVYILGVPYMYGVLNLYLKQPTGVKQVVVTGFLMTIGGDIPKALLAALIAKRLIPITKTKKARP
jgi:biotin transport system substrate-specific component